MKSKKLFQLVLGAIVIVTLTSCNKGVGCPYEMSITDILSILPF